MGIRISNKSNVPYICILPAVILILVFLAYPIMNVFYYSFQSYNPNLPWMDGFAGFDNFARIFTDDPVVASSLKTSVEWVLVEVSLQFIFGLALALILNQAFRGRNGMRAVVFAPWAISGVLTSMIWALLYNQNIGLINDLLLKAGIINEPVAWLANRDCVFWSVIVAELWRGIPFFAILLLAGLQTIPLELYEACKMDGGGKIRQFISVTLPYLKDSIILSSLLRVVWEFNNVDLIYTLTGGGPANQTTTLVMYITNTAIRDQDFGYGSALSVVAFVILLAFALIYLKLTNFGKEDLL